MEETPIENTAGLSDVKFGEDKNHSDKLARLYELYESGRYNDLLSAMETDSLAKSTSYGQLLLGNTYNQLGKKEDALSHWKKAIEISPLEHSAYINIGNYYYASGNVKEAIQNWQVATTIMPENPTVNLNLALAYDKKGNRIKSTKYFEKYLKYETKVTSNEYVMVKQRFANLTAKVDFYAKKVEEYKF